MATIPSMPWVWNPFAGSPSPAAASFAASVPYVPAASAPCATDGECDCLTVGESRDVLFFPVAAGTTSPEVPTALDDVDDWKVILKGFGLSVNLEYTDAAGTLDVDLATGRIRADLTAVQTATFRAGSYGTAELWRVSPVLAVVARRRYRVFP